MKAQGDGGGKPQQGHFFGGVCVTESVKFARFETLKLAMSPQVGPLRSIFGGVVTLHRITGDLHLKSLGILETTRKLLVR